MPGQVSTEKYTVTLPGKLKGDYWLAIQLFDKKSGKPVAPGLSADIKQNDHFLIQKLSF
jgi:hypothetical protein